MSGLLSSLRVMMSIASNVQEDGVAKGALKSLEDKNIQLIKADGSMIKLLGKYIVEPVAVVTDDLKDVDELEHILGLHMDLFTGWYMQVFDIMRDHYGIKPNVAVDALATDNGGLMRVIAAGIDKGINLSEENEDLVDYLGEMLRCSGYSVDETGTLSKESDEDDVEEQVRKEFDKKSREEAIALGVKKDNRERRFESDLNDAYDKENIDHRIGEKKRKRLMGIDKNKRVYYLNRDVDRVPTGLNKAHRDLLIPNAIQRTIEITNEVPMAEPGTDGKLHTRKIITPVTIKLAVIFTSTENIINAISTRSSEYSFSERLDDYRSGAISLADFLLASDLVEKYKKRKIKDKDALLSIMQARELSANSKIVHNGFAGFEKYYNMFFLSPEAKTRVEKEVRAKLATTKGKDRFLEQANGLSVCIVDPDYERVQIMVKDIHGKTDLSFRNAVKKDKGGSDYSEIIKALMANKPPAF